MGAEIFLGKQMGLDWFRKLIDVIGPYQKQILVETITSCVEKAVRVIHEVKNLLLRIHRKHFDHRNAVLFSFGTLDNEKKR